MASKLDIYVQAALILKLRAVADLSESTHTRVTFDALWDSVVAYMLEAHGWRFAARAVSLDPVTTETPAYGYSYYFDKPSDFVRLIAISSSPYDWPTLDDFSEEGDVWAANCNPLFIEYVSNDTSKGMNIGAWRASFGRAVAYELADRAAGSLTKLGDDELKLIEKEKMNALHTAKTRDSIGQPAARPGPGLLTRSRMGRRTISPWSWVGPGS
jgi:hypothetical protein